MPSLAERALRLSVSNYHRLQLETQRPTELIDGRIVEMNPIGTAHRVVVTRLQRQLDAVNQQERLLVGQPIRVSGYDEPQPDVTILRTPQPMRSIIAEREVELVIEVSDSTLDRDRNDKLPHYLAVGLDVWIVNIRDHAHPQLEMHTPENPTARVHTTGQIEASAEPRALIDLDVLFQGLGSLPYDEPADGEDEESSPPGRA